MYGLTFQETVKLLPEYPRIALLVIGATALSVAGFLMVLLVALLR
jgi:hypothetical protein